MPVVYRQLPVSTPLPAEPLKSSRNSRFQPPGGDGADACAVMVAATVMAAVAAAAATSTASRRTRGCVIACLQPERCARALSLGLILYGPLIDFTRWPPCAIDRPMLFA